MNKKQQEKLREASDYEDFRVSALQVEVQALYLSNLSRRVGLLPLDPPENWRAQKAVFDEKVYDILRDIRAFIET